MIQWNVCEVCSLIYKHGVSLTERSSAHVLTTDTHIEP